MPGGRVLMIAHHFPPMGGSGSNRALAFARDLPTYQWTPIVLTPGVAWAVHRDDALLREVPTDLRVVRTKSLESRTTVVERPRNKSSSGPTSSVRSQFGHLKRFPDAHLGWLPFALAAARRQAYDVAHSSSGPFTAHLIGWLLKRMTHKPWVAELRDGWYRWNRAIFPDYPAWRDALERRLESAALREADRVVLVTERMAQAFRCQYADLPARHFAVVANGFDPTQFSKVPAASRSTTWELVHTGSLYYGRSVAAILGAVRRLVDSDPDFARDFRLRLIGTIDAAAQQEIICSDLGDRIQQLGQVGHAAAISHMHSADALLLVANTTPGAEATVPGKLFEYLAVGRPILAVAPPESSTADVLRQTGGGWLAPAGEPAAIACVLREAYTKRATPPTRNQGELAKFDRREQAGGIARIFDQVVANAARRL